MEGDHTWMSEEHSFNTAFTADLHMTFTALNDGDKTHGRYPWRTKKE